LKRIDFTIAKTSLFQQIVEALEQVIVQSEEDEKLPSEQELSERFNVSKVVIREALKVLQDRGLVRVRNGDGSYISRPQTDTVALAVNRIVKMTNISNDNLHDTRVILETATARLAARHISDGEIAFLDETIERMSDLSMPHDDWLKIDMSFHVAIARASRNDLLVMFVEAMMQLLKEYMLKGLDSRYDQNLTLNEHREILKGIRMRDPDYAEKAMLEHFISGKTHVSQYEEAKRRAAARTGKKRGRASIQE
jgi:DNA-binding FadR family transcriptional regulator